MAAAPNYNPSYNFTNFQDGNPTTPLPANEVDSELVAVSLSINGINSNLQHIQRADGQLSNSSVGPDQLQPGYNLGVSSFAAWTGPGHGYLANQGVINGNAIYYCKVSHTSTSSFSGDLASGFWGLVIDFSSFLIGQLATFVTPISFRNGLLNSCGAVAQRGTSFTGVSGLVQTLDCWFGWCFGGGSNATISQQSGATSSDGLIYPNLIRLQRPAANASVQAHALGQILRTVDAKRFAGKACNLSFSARKGSNFSAAGNLLSVRVETGTGTDEGSASLIAATWTGGAVALSTTQAISSTLTRYTIPVTIGANVTELSTEFYFTPVGTASTNDYFEVTGVQLEVAGATAHELVPFDVELDRCQAFVEKSFQYATAPVQNAAVNTGEYYGIAGKAGALQQNIMIPFKVRKFKTPTMTYYNPAAANAQIRDTNANTDSTGAANQMVSQAGACVTATGNASSAVGNQIAIHWLADAAL